MERREAPAPEEEFQTLENLLSATTSHAESSEEILPKKSSSRNDIIGELEALTLEDLANAPLLTGLIDTAETYKNIRTVQRIRAEIICTCMLSVLAWIYFVTNVLGRPDLPSLAPERFEAVFLFLTFLLLMMSNYYNYESAYLGETFKGKDIAERNEQLDQMDSEQRIKLESILKSLGYDQYKGASLKKTHRLIIRHTKPLRKTIQHIRRKGQERDRNVAEAVADIQNEEIVAEYIEQIRQMKITK